MEEFTAETDSAQDPISKEGSTEDSREDSKEHAKGSSNGFSNDLDLLAKALQDGNLKHAKKIHVRIQKSPEANHSSRKIRDRFRSLSNKLKELEDWQIYATSPKRRVLCEKMEALVTSDDHPEQKVNEIKRLHKDWQQLGPSNTREAQRLWSRFKSASDKAYDACTVYFKQRDEVREQNLAQRKEICAEIEQFAENTNWFSVDYRTVAELINKSHKKWHQYKDIPHKEHRAINEQFFSLLEPIQQKLDEEQQRNYERKQDLIDQLQSTMETTDDVETLVEKTKEAQVTWKGIGVTHRNSDQKLWKKFRRLCDQVFSRRDQATKQKRKDSKTTQNAAKKICDELSKLLNRDFSKEHFQALRSEYFQLDNPPLQQEFNKLVKRIEQRIEELNELEIVSEIKRKASICNLLEDRTYSLEQANAAWESAIVLPKSVEQQLKNRLNKVTTDDDLPSIERICVEVEMLAGIESQDSDAIRMEIQMEKLQKGLAEGIREDRSKQQQFRDLQRSFYCQPSLHQRCFVERFHTAEQQLEKRVSLG